jgi:hypothetical protein
VPGGVTAADATVIDAVARTFDQPAVTSIV